VDGQRRAPAALLPAGRPDTQYTENWVSPRAGLAGCRKFRPHRDSISGPSRSESLHFNIAERVTVERNYNFTKTMQICDLVN
jgi:hypothetical protein